MSGYIGAPLFAVGPCASTKKHTARPFLEEPNSGWVTCRRPCPCDHSSDCQPTTWCETKWDRRDTAISLINEFLRIPTCLTEGRRHYSCNGQLCCERWEDWENVAVHYSGHSFCFRSPHYQLSKLWLLNSTHGKKGQRTALGISPVCQTSSKINPQIVAGFHFLAEWTSRRMATFRSAPRSPMISTAKRQPETPPKKSGTATTKPGNTQPESGPGDSRPSSSPWMFRVAQNTR